MDEMISAPVIEPFMRGTFRLWETPDGGFRIAYRPDSTDEDNVLVIPGAVIKMARMASEGKGNPLAMMKGMFSGK